MGKWTTDIMPYSANLGKLGALLNPETKGISLVSLDN